MVILEWPVKSGVHPKKEAGYLGTVHPAPWHVVPTMREAALFRASITSETPKLGNQRILAMSAKKSRASRLPAIRSKLSLFFRRQEEP